MGTMPAGDNPHSISEKKAALRESPKQPNNPVNEQPTSSPSLKDKVSAVTGSKRSQPNGCLTPTNHHTLGNSGVNFVYVRRRLDTDQSKGGTSRGENVGSISSKKTVAGGLQSQEQSLKHQSSVAHTQPASSFASPAAVTAAPPLPSANLPAYHPLGKQSPGKVSVQPTTDVTTSLPPRNVMACSTPVLQCSVAANLSTSSVSATGTSSCDAISATIIAHKGVGPARSSKQDWSDRFMRLQAFLRNNEQSGQEEYICRLRSLSPVGRSKHAIELEKRAASLLVEEGEGAAENESSECTRQVFAQ
ncbi:hypothetical protein ACP4OV_025563 [Aristida adscensionis]